ncbi:MAG: radical SAM protein [Candidatus Aenigmarchaeota archaeon]|nr:radical SAM protein [Candidatus Aenigmarchaeota archaeon]
MRVKEIKCKSILNKSKLADYCINCYVGCEHSCVYCYADYYTKKYSQHKEEWGSFVDVKINAQEILRREILKKKKGSVFLSSLTDPYQPLEKKYELTRKCLEILQRNNFSVCIQTKSSLVLRDLEILKNFKDCEVGLTITTLNEKIRKDFEPFSSSVEDKLKALRVLKESGIRTYVFFGPVLPFLSDENLNEFFEKLSGLANYFFVDKLNLKPGIWEKCEKVLKENYPELLEKWQEIFFGKSEYYQNLKDKIRAIANKNNLKVIFCY